MPSRSSCRRHLLLAGAVVVVVVAALAAAVAAAARSPGYCAPGKAFPRSPLPHCRWYVASRSPCGVAAVPLLPLWYMKDMCCRQLGLVPAECRCEALRVMMMEAAGARLLPRPAAAAEERCRELQRDFAAALVTEAECGLSTVHGMPYCDALAAED